MQLSTDPVNALVAFRFFFVFTVFLPVFAVPFFYLFGRTARPSVFGKKRFWLAAFLILIGLTALSVKPQWVLREIYFSEGQLWGLRFTFYGKLVGVYLLIMNVLGLFFLDNTYRAASLNSRVTMKYPLLGMLIASVFTFVAISRMLAVSIADSNVLAIHSCSLIALSGSFFYASLRYRLFDVQAYLGRDVVTSVLTVTIAGLYLLALALISLLAKVLGLSYDRFAFSVVGLFAIFLLLAVMFSGKAKRRLRHFIETNFYSSRYDYRKEWHRYAHLMATSETVNEFLSSFIVMLSHTMMADQGLIQVNVEGGNFAVYGMNESEITLPAVDGVAVPPGETVWLSADGPGAGLMDRLRRNAGDRPDLDWIRAAAVIGAADDPLGLILLGKRTGGTSYTEEDRQCLATLADQAALTLEGLLYKEQIMEAKQMESFNRFSSFVIHDLKNAVSMLSLTAENARENMDDPQFRADAFESIERSIQKMKGLIHSLNALKAPTNLVRKKLDLTALAARVAERMIPVAESRNTRLECQAGGPVFVEADGSALERVVENLVLNAIDAAPDGRVSLTVVAGTNGWVELAVADTGGGFEPVYLKEHLFRPFRSTKKGGLGIGLVMCRALTRAHGGDIVINNDPARGAVVTVRLPDGSTGGTSPDGG
jgi:signal transduction histidine kinase